MSADGNRYPLDRDIEAHVAKSLSVYLKVVVEDSSTTTLNAIVLKRRRSEVLQILDGLLEDRICCLSASYDQVRVTFRFPYKGPNDKNCIHEYSVLVGYDAEVANSLMIHESDSFEVSMKEYLERQ